MTRLRSLTARFAVLFTATFAALAAPGLPNAPVYAAPMPMGHRHPSPADLAAPGVVYIESGYHVQIALIEHGGGVHIKFHQRTYDAVLNRGSGFVVDPSAVIVTSAAVTSPDEQAAKNYAINSIFGDTYGAGPTLILPADRLRQRSFDPAVGRSGDYSTLARLKGCYAEKPNSAGGCVVTTTKFVTVHPYVTDQTKYGNLDAKVLTSTASGVTVLRVPAGSMPTVDPANVTPSISSLWVLGFHGIPADRTFDSFKVKLSKPGGSTFGPPTGDNAPFAAVTPAVLSGGLQGAPVAGELGRVYGMISAPSATPGTPGKPGPGEPTLIGMSAIRAALSLPTVRVTPTRGPADDGYASAMHRFVNQGYAASIPGLQQALKAYPGHYLATKYSKKAVALAKSMPAPVAPSSSSPKTPAVGPGAAKGLAWWVWVLIAVGVLLPVLAVWWLTRRRRHRPRDPRAGTPPLSPPGRSPSKPSPQAPPRGSASVLVDNNRSAARGSIVRTPGADAREPTANADSKVLTRQEPPRARGSIAESPGFCTSCGGRLAAHHAFCGWCGEPVC